MEAKQRCLFLFALILLFLHSTKIQAQSPAAAPAHAPANPAKKPPPATAASPPVMVPAMPTKGTQNVVKILQKAGHFTFFIRLIKSTQEDLQIFSTLNSSRDGLTVFAPTDDAFSSIVKSGTLNSLEDQQKISLVQFHLVPKYISRSQFQTVTNPLKNLAGSGKKFSLNVVTTDTSVNVTTGVTNANVTGIVYSDGKVSIYPVDKVLLPLAIFDTINNAPAPAPVVATKPAKAKGAESPVVPKDTSSGSTLRDSTFVFGLSLLAAIVYL